MARASPRFRRSLTGGSKASARNFAVFRDRVAVFRDRATLQSFASRAWTGSWVGTLSRGLFDFAMLCIASLDWLVGWNACTRNFADRFASLRARVTLYSRELEGSRSRELEGSRTGDRELEGSRDVVQSRA